MIHAWLVAGAESILRALGAALLSTLVVFQCWAADNGPVSIELVRAYYKPDRPYLLRFAEEHRDSPLYPVVMARAVDVRSVAASPPKGVLDLLNQRGVPAVEKLRGALLKEWARTGNWTYFERHDPLVPAWYAEKDVELACARLAYARSNRHTVQKQWVATILVQDSKFPDLCGQALRGALHEGVLSPELALQKGLAVAAFEGQKAADVAAQSLGNDLDRMSRYQGMVGKALSILSLARSNFEVANTRLRRLARSMDPELFSLVAVHLGGIAARQHRPDGHLMIKEANGYSLAVSRVASEWRCRAAIWASAWDDLVVSINSLPLADRDSSVWMYWRAVGLQKMGRKADGQAIMSRLAETNDYYGLLARGNKFFPHSSESPKLPSTQEWVVRMSATEEYKRAIALYAAGLWVEGALEMNVLLQGKSPAEYLAAAELAQRNNIPDRQISYSERAGQASKLTIAYPLMYINEVTEASGREGVPAATIFAIIRQESRFVPYAVSSAGALGLMQLMPNTAKKLIKSRSKNTKVDESILFKSSINIELGTKFLGQLGKRYSWNLARMAAAYNAGPNRVDRWLQNQHRITDAVFVELIPYDETRDYVKAVTINEALYRSNINKLKK